QNEHRHHLDAKERRNTQRVSQEIHERPAIDRAPLLARERDTLAKNPEGPPFDGDHCDTSGTKAMIAGS
ncbi:MAG: hypothetical protein ACE10B_07395, partial [Phycisphaerales bacterium]